MLLALPAQAQDTPSVQITPAAGIAEQAVFDILISGLAPDSAYTIEILYEGAAVFSSDETSDAAGEIDYPITSTEGDAPGIYTLQVLSGGDIVASADFELTAVDASSAAEERDFLGDVTVSPATAPFGKVQTIRIGELESNADFTIEVTASDTQQVAYRKIHRSDDDGIIEIEVFAQEGDAPGHHAIAVYDEAGELIAEGEFTIEPPPERAVAVALRPATILPGAARRYRGQRLGALRQRDRSNHLRRWHLDRHRLGARLQRRRSHASVQRGRRPGGWRVQRGNLCRRRQVRQRGADC